MKTFGIIALMLLVSIPVVSASFESVQRITPEELKNLLESGTDIVVVDVQPKVAYEMGHIKGAINFPWAAEIKPPLALPRNKPVILYCDCAHEEDAEDVARQLNEKWGYTNIRVLEGGWSKWRKLGYPVEKSRNEGSKRNREKGMGGTAGHVPTVARQLPAIKGAVVIAQGNNGTSATYEEKLILYS